MVGIAIVTGGSRGIGSATSTLLAAQGWDVAIGYHVDADAAHSVAAACRKAGRRAIARPVDVASEEAVDRFFSTIDDELGPPRLWSTARVSSAIRLASTSSRPNASSHALGQCPRLFLCAREAVRRMSHVHGGAGGAIVNLSSAASRLGSPGEYIDYAASKGAIDTMTLGLAREVACEGIRVNAVRPGLVNTGIHASGGQPDRLERLAPLIPMGRVGEPLEVAHAIAWLCSDEASYVTGVLIDISGGR